MLRLANLEDGVPQYQGDYRKGPMESLMPVNPASPR